MAHDEPRETVLHFNGVDAVGGGYGLAPMTGSKLAQMIGKEHPPANLDDLKDRRKRDARSPEAIARLEFELAVAEAALAGAQDPTQTAALQGTVQRLRDELARRQHLGVQEGVDAKNFAEAGWGIVFAAGADPAVKEALAPLLALREAQAGARFRVYEGGKGYRGATDSKTKFLERNGASPSGPVEPDKMPYYLLIVGDPAAIPFEFQYQLDVQYAVGRIQFDTPAEYEAYARSVVEVETRGNSRPRRLSFFGVENPGDPMTRLSAAQLVEPLHAALKRNSRESGWGWEIDACLRDDARRTALERLLGGGADTPALLFTASHGVEFPPGDPRLRARQGALLCSDWPGPEGWKGEIPEQFYFAGEHLDQDADLRGLIVFAFACFAAGTPQFDDFSRLAGSPRKQIAPAPFVSGLARSLLGRKNGALAMIGHVDRAWSCSFSRTGILGAVHSHTEMFRSALARLLGGSPVGHAFEYVNERYAELSTVLSNRLDAIDAGEETNPYELIELWTENNDARDYVVLGDPAVRLAFGPQTSGDTPMVRTADIPGAGSTERPAEISEADWQATPLAVRALLNRLRAQQR